VSAKRRRTQRDARRRSLGQNFLVDRTEINRLVDAIDVHPGELIIEIGAGIGALTLPLVQAGASVIAIERDPIWARQLHDKVREKGLLDQVEIVRRDFRTTEWQSETYRVVSNPPFGLTTALFARLFDIPAKGPLRADLLVQREVARKRAATPPTTLRSASWAPWWTFQLGHVVPRTAFRPVSQVDAALLVVRRRDPPVLPEWLAPQLRELIRPAWNPPSS